MMKRLTLTLVACAAMLLPSSAQKILPQNRVNNIYTSSMEMSTRLLTEQNTSVNVCRTLFAGYNSLCLPVTVSAEQLNQNSLRVERFAGIKQMGNDVQLLFVDCTAEGMVAGQPYLVYSLTHQYVKFKNDGDVSLEPIEQTMTDGQNIISFNSSWKAIQKEGRYGIPAQQESEVLESVLIATEGDKYFMPTRCGFDWTQRKDDAANLVIKHVTAVKDEYTDIKQLKSTNTPLDIYTLDGALVKQQCTVSQARQTLPKGIYVIDGQKIIIK